MTPAQIRELRSIAWDGNPSDPVDWQHAPGSLWFHARDRVIGALLRRGLIEDKAGLSITEAGKKVLRDHGYDPDA